MEIMTNHSGSWHNPDQSGRGISIEVVNPETPVIFWYAYHLDEIPQWFAPMADMPIWKRGGSPAAGSE